MRKNIEETSADELKRMRRSAYIKMAAMVGIVVAVLAFGSLAWFTMSREAEGSGVQMTSGDLPFEIKTTGTVTPNSSILGALGFKDGTAVTGGYSSIGKGDIKWMLESNDKMAGEGLSPGTQGTLNFTIVPSEYDNTKTLTVKYSLNLKAYKLADEKKAQIAEISAKIAKGEKDENNQPYTLPEVTLEDMILLSSDTENQNYSKALDYIQGHILFFKNADNTGRLGLGETQTITFNCAQDQVVPLHWVWPETLGNMVMTSNGVTNICTGDEKTALISHIQNNPSIYFVMGNLDSDMLDENGKLKANVIGTDLTDNYPVLNLAYNNADQVIGTDAQYILLELVVDGVLN